MKKLVLALSVLACGASASFAQTINNLGAGRGSVLGTDLFPSYQGANPAVRPSAAQIAAYVYGLTSGDATISGTGAVAFATVNSNVGSFGSATQCATVTVNAKGLITAASQATCAPAIGSVAGLGTGVAAFLATPSSANLLAALTTKTGTGSAVFGTAPTIDSLNATTAVTLAWITGSTQCLQVNTSGAISGTGAVCGGSGSTGANPTATAGPTANNGVATTFMRSDASPAVQKASNAQFGLMEGDGSTITCTAGVCSAPPAVTSRSVTVTTDTILAADLGNVVFYNSASAVAITQPAPTGSFASGFFTTVCNVNVGVLTITPGSGTIGGAATKTIPAATELQPACLTYQSNGTNFRLIPDYTIDAALLTAGTINAARLPFGTGVGTAAAANLSAAGGLASTIASGTAALGTSAIASGACATVVTVAATNVATTDIVMAGFAADPTATTGFLPTAMLTIVPYPTAGNANFKVCNLTASSITPSAVTINWRVLR